MIVNIVNRSQGVMNQTRTLVLASHTANIVLLTGCDESDSYSRSRIPNKYRRRRDEQSTGLIHHTLVPFDPVSSIDTIPSFALILCIGTRTRYIGPYQLQYIYLVNM
jgi:hypothetical protein